ncbi:MAG: DUF58 domain-containing protein [Lachnospiraceae bacterium]|nr:DUF58 domain-containing protein [Lachnospiraceae bacterium]
MTKIIGIGIIAFLLFYIQKQIYKRLWNRDLKVHIRFASTEMFQGDTGQMLEVVENRKRLPLPVLKVKFQTDRNLLFADKEGSKVTDLLYWNDVFQVGGGEKITRTLTFTAKKRGYYKVLGIDLVSADLFLTTQMVDSRQEECYLYVYPKPYISPELQHSLQMLNGEILTRRHLLEDPFEYRGIREYQPYDDMRSVNWKATARTGEIKVNQKNYTSLQTIRIFFNVEDTGILKKEEAVEMCFRLVAGIAQFFLSQGIRIAVYGNGVDIMNGEVMSVEAGAGSGQMDRIYKALARVDTTKPVVSFREIFGEKLLTEDKSTRTMIVAPNAYQDFLELLEDYDKMGGDYVWFYPIWEKEPPQIPQWATPHVRWIPAREEIK